MIHLLVWSLIWNLIRLKALFLIGVVMLAVLLAMTGIGIVVFLLFGEQMKAMMAGDGCCSCMGTGSEPEGSQRV